MKDLKTQSLNYLQQPNNQEAYIEEAVERIINNKIE